jgi:hypothetical protein
LRGRSFIDSALDLVDAFYRDVVQHLKAWAATPPKLRTSALVPEPVELASTALSSQDGAEPIDSDDVEHSREGTVTAQAPFAGATDIEDKEPIALPASGSQQPPMCP